MIEEKELEDLQRLYQKRIIKASTKSFHLSKKLCKHL